MQEFLDLNKIPAKGAFVGLLAATTVVGAVAAYDPKLAGIIMFGMLLMTLATAKFIWIRSLIRKRRAQSLTGELSQQSAVTPAGISERPQIEKLQGLRQTFQSGLDKFRVAGKDLYKLPWYVIVGEPGAGKTEVIRHCDIGFPPGMQEEEFQGVGGTINMNWWFTNRGVILDTAGRLLFEKVSPGATGEWKEFLRLLRKHRPNCPINGLLLAIPADSLIKDSGKKIEERAGWIARQFDNIQRELDIRFPVYVIITKCDLLNGFREFFEHADNPDAQRQMLGWSNPDELDQPYRPELVDEHLHTVVERLRKIRLRLLEDPVARDSSHRRIDEVDRPFAFPNSVSLIAESLRHYLSTIFVASEWALKPLFLRGIYFTSSLREGAELDQELAQIIGVPVDELPAGRAWERDTSFFLRDLFLEKIMPEWGMVTRATNTKRLLRRRFLALIGCGTGALAAVSLFSWFGYKAMKESIGRQSGYWLRASEGWTADNKWMPIVSETGGRFTYHGDQPVGRGTQINTRDLFDGAGKTLVSFHATLRDLTEGQLRISPVFRPFYRLVGNFDAERKRDQRIVLEGSVIMPLLEAARHKIVSAGKDASSDDSALELDALLSLIKLESGIVKRSQHMTDGIAPADSIMGPLLACVVSKQKTYDAAMPDVIAWTYSKGDGASAWPAGWMSGGGTLDKARQSDKLVHNQAIDAGIEHFRTGALLALEDSKKRFEQIKDFVKLLTGEYAKSEQKLFDARDPQAGIEQFDPRLEGPFKAFSNIASDLRDKLRNSEKAGMFGEGPVSLLSAYELATSGRENLLSKFRTNIAALLNEIASAEIKGGPRSPLLDEIKARLQAVQSEIQSEPDKLDTAVLAKLDKAYLGAFKNKGPAYDYRFRLYSRSIAVAREEPSFDKLIGTNWGAIGKLLEDLKTAGDDVTGYEGVFEKELRLLCRYWLDIARTSQIDKCCKAYLKEARDSVAPKLRFPLIWSPDNPDFLSGSDVVAVANKIAVIHRELQSDVFNSIPEVSRSPLTAYDKGLALLDPVLQALVLPGEKGPNSRLATFKLSMNPVLRPQPPDAVPDVPGFTPLRPPTPGYEIRSGTPDVTDSRIPGPAGRVFRIDQPAVISSGISMDIPFHFHYWVDGIAKRGKENLREVPIGKSWCALYLLSKGGATTLDGIKWDPNWQGPYGPIPLSVQFERALPSIQAWPKEANIGALRY